MNFKRLKTYPLSTFFLVALIVIFLLLLIYLYFFMVQPLRITTEKNHMLIEGLKAGQNSQKTLLKQINQYREDLYGMNLVLEARKNVISGGAEENPYLVFDFRQVLNDLRQLLPEDARATKIQINNAGLMTMPVESVDYASLGRVLKSFKDKSQQLMEAADQNSPKKAFIEVKIPAGVQRSIEQSTEGKTRRMKNVYSFVLQAQLNPEFWQNSMAYSDVSATTYYADAVKELTLVGGIEGYADGTFKPLQPITRAEFFKLALFQFLTQQAISPEEYKHYLDLSEKNWAYRYAQLAHQKGLVEEDETDRFHPDQPLRRIEALTNVFTIFHLKAQPLASNGSLTVLPFRDIDRADPNLPLILAAHKKGLLDQMGQEFQSDLPITRAEIAYWVWKLQSD